MGIADHKIVHDEKYVVEKLNKYTLITTSAWRNSNNSSCGNDFESALSDVEPFNARILCANFNGNPATTVFVPYAPVEGKEEANEHYAKLTNAVNAVPKHNITIVIGDCNSVNNVGAYGSFGSIGSDHRVFTARLKLSLRSERASPRRKTYDWGALGSE